ncbi:MAG TPA: hypothetical protein VK891_12430, partial [Euzebyales bacterium]|nr:hypothetical protein [Euzebyales bacterium]
PPKVSTAWVVRLPHALPSLTSADLLRLSGDKVKDPAAPAAERTTDSEQSTGTDPAVDALAADLLVDEVVTVTREGLPSWWINGSVLASATHAGHRAEEVTLVTVAEAIAWLAAVLGSPELARHALPATGAYDARSAY